MVWDSARNLSEFLGRQRIGLGPMGGPRQSSPQRFWQGSFSSLKEALFQFRWAHWQGRQGGRALAKNLLPKGPRWIHQD
jgi:hypothetical protein